MKKEKVKVTFDNQTNPKSFFDIVKVEELLQKQLNHDIFKTHIVQFYVIFFVYEGQGYHTIDFTDYNYSDGTVLLIRKDQIHKFFRSPNVKGFLLVFTEDFILSHLNAMEASKAMQLFNEALSYPKIEFNSMDEFHDFTVLIKHLSQEYMVKDDFSIGITRSVLHIVITKLFRVKAKKGNFQKRKKHLPQFLEFQKFVNDDCFESKKVQYYAMKMGVSSKTLNNIVKSVLNISPKVFIDERVMIQIKRLLIGTDLSIKEIAYMSGFSDSTNFFKYFKKFASISPMEFRNAH